MSSREKDRSYRRAISPVTHQANALKVDGIVTRNGLYSNEGPMFENNHLVGNIELRYNHIRRNDLSYQPGIVPLIHFSLEVV
jgi:hypothetical protein